MAYYIIETRFGCYYCSACQSLLSDEEAAFGECDACGGEGIPGEDDYWDYDEPASADGRRQRG